MTKSRGAQRGAAILSALLVVALAAVIVSSLLWRESVQIRRVENERLSAQAAVIERSTTDWTRLILRSVADAAPTVDYLAQVWSVPVAETRLSDFLSQIGEVRAEQGAATYLSGQVEDAQARFNLRNLEPVGGKVDPIQLDAFRRLLSIEGLNEDLAQATVKWLKDAANSDSGAILTDDAESLLDVPGYSQDVLDRLGPFITLLPIPTTVNVNTASAPVIAAVLELDLAQAETVVAQRTSETYLRSLADLTTILARYNRQAVPTTMVDVRTHFFIVHARVRHEVAEIQRDTLIYRIDGAQHATRIVSTKDVL